MSTQDRAMNPPTSNGHDKHRAYQPLRVALNQTQSSTQQALRLLEADYNRERVAIINA